MATLCGAKTRSGNPCKRAVTPGRNRCKFHGGKSLRGAASGTFKHGRYSKCLKGDLKEKFVIADENPLDLLPELHIQRVLLEQQLERVSNQKSLTMDEAQATSALAQDVVKTAAMIVKCRNDTALTVVEVRFIQMRMIEIVEKYVPDPERRRSFIRELGTLIPGRTNAAGSESEPISIPARTVQTSPTT